MAKRRKLTRHRGPDRERRSVGRAKPFAELSRWAQVMERLGTGALMVWTAVLAISVHWPADSVAVEQGSALAVTLLALLATGLAWFYKPVCRGLAMDAVLWAMVGWIALSGWVQDGQINSRAATNEVWFWVAAVGCVTSVRRIGHLPGVRGTLTLLLVGSALLLALHGWHQVLVSFPADRARFEREPDQVLAEAGVDAPPGSAQRMMFENRLRDGGPIATFALTNSLAAVLVGAVLALGVWLALGWQRMGRWNLGLAVAALVVIGGLLLQTRSRSAYGAVLIMSVFAAVLHWREMIGQPQRLAQPPRSRQQWLVAAALAAAVLVAGGVFALANPELTERAGASFAFRLQYWRGTLAMVVDRPWFGCGPGAFQAAYEAYRERSASEQIADPHNFLMETLAAGGVPAAIALVAAAVLAVKIMRNRHRGLLEQAFETDIELLAYDSGAPNRPESRRTRIAAGGSGFAAGWAMVWIIGTPTGWAPDFAAHAIAVPLTLVWLAFMLVQLLRVPPPRGIVPAAMGGILIHLMLSGGWTVPGVAIPLSILVGLATSVGDTASQDEVSGQTHWEPNATLWGPRAAVLVVTAVVGFSFYQGTYLPVLSARQASVLAELAAERGRLDQLESAYRRLRDADPRDPAGLVGLVRAAKQRLLFQDQPSLREAFEEAEALAIAADPVNPSLRRLLGELRLHLYQRWGKKIDLKAAQEQFARASERSPSDERIAAQLAVIWAELAKRTDVAEEQSEAVAEAKRWRAEAESLSAAGGHIERQLERVVVLVARPLDKKALVGPQRKPAAELLRETYDLDGSVSIGDDS